jgi:hypothetical protein
MMINAIYRVNIRKKNDKFDREIKMIEIRRNVLNSETGDGRRETEGKCEGVKGRENEGATKRGSHKARERQSEGATKRGSDKARERQSEGATKRRGEGEKVRKCDKENESN